MTSIENTASFTLMSDRLQLIDPMGAVQTESYAGDLIKYKDLYEQILHKHKPKSSIKSVQVIYKLEGERFRCTVYSDIDGLSIAVRRMHKKAPTLNELNIDPKEVLSLVKGPGLVLFCGAIGSGKSTTLLSTTNQMGPKALGMTMSLESPVEYIYQNKAVHQRSVGIEVESYAQGIKEAMLCNSKTIIIQEINDIEAARAAILAGLSGHSVLGTMHAESPADAFSRLVALAGNEMMGLASRSLAGLFCQRMIYSAEKNQVRPVYESIVVDNGVKQIFETGSASLQRIPAAIRKQGRKVFWDVGEDLIRDGFISQSELEIQMPKRYAGL